MPWRCGRTQPTLPPFPTMGRGCTFSETRCEHRHGVLLFAQASRRLAVTRTVAAARAEEDVVVGFGRGGRESATGNLLYPQASAAVPCLPSLNASLGPCWQRLASTDGAVARASSKTFSNRKVRSLESLAALPRELLVRATRPELEQIHAARQRAQPCVRHSASAGLTIAGLHRSVTATSSTNRSTESSCQRSWCSAMPCACCYRAEQHFLTNAPAHRSLFPALTVP
jgi:hypothetical protein